MEELINVFVALMVLGLVGFTTVAGCFLYPKAGKPWWNAIVPFYNIWVLLEIVRRPRWWIFPLLLSGLSAEVLGEVSDIPGGLAVLVVLLNVVQWVFVVLVANALARSFGQGIAFTVGLSLLPFVFLPLLAFGSYTYQYQPSAGLSDEVGESIVRLRDKVVEFLDRLRRG